MNVSSTVNDEDIMLKCCVVTSLCRSLYRYVKIMHMHTGMFNTSMVILLLNKIRLNTYSGNLLHFCGYIYGYNKVCAGNVKW